MNIQQEIKQQIIKEALEFSQISDLQKELNIPSDDLLNYLILLYSNISKEVSPGIFLMPPTGGKNLQKFIEFVNKQIITKWLKEQTRNFESDQTLPNLIKTILLNYERLEPLAKSLSFDNVLKFKELGIPIIAAQLIENYEKVKFQVYENFYLAEIDQSESKHFFTLLNKEVALSCYPIEDEKHFEIEFSSHDNIDLNNFIEYDQNSLKTHLINFLNKLNLKLPPNNQQKPQRLISRGRRVKSLPEIGTFDQYSDLQSFKLLSQMHNQLFERTHLLRYLKSHPDPLLIHFNSKIFDGILQFTHEVDGQAELSEQLLLQLENAKFNIRELKEHFYKLMFLSIQDILEKSLKEWVQRNYYNNLTKSILPITKRPQNYRYLYESPFFYWFDCIGQLISRLNTRIYVKKVFNQRWMQYKSTSYLLQTDQFSNLN